MGQDVESMLEAELQGMGVAGTAVKTKRMIMPVICKFFNETSNQVRRNLQGMAADI